MSNGPTNTGGPLVPTFEQDEQRHRRRLATWASAINSGNLQCVGTVTLTASATTTTVTDSRVSPGCFIGLSPLTSDAAGALGTTYVSTTTNGSFTLTHSNAASVDRTFTYCVLG